ncbi:hypothetical protein HDR58_06220 [bacterium]|nr:hypothetical protein [bacterium]
MSINGLGNVGYYPQATTFTSRKQADNAKFDFQPGFVQPEKNEKSNKGKKVLTTAAVVTTLAAATWFFTKGKGQKYVAQLKDYFTNGKGSEYLQKAKDFFKNLFGKGGKKDVPTAVPVQESVAEVGTKVAEQNNKVPEVGTKVVEKNNKVPDVATNIDTKGTNANTRKLVDEALNDVPTKAQQAAYDKSIAYVAPNAEEKAAIAVNNSAAHKATAEARQIQNNLSDETLSALEKFKKDLEKAEKVPTYVKEPSAQVKKQQIEQAWAEYTRRPEVKAPTVQNIPTREQIWAKAEAEAAKVAKEEAEVMAQMFPTPKKVDLKPTTEPAKALDPKLWNNAPAAPANTPSAEELEMLAQLGF